MGGGRGGAGAARAPWDTLARRVADDEPWKVTEEVVPLDLVDRVVGPDGPREPADALTRVDCPVAPELMREIQ